MAHTHNNDVIMSAITSQITGVSIVCANVCSGADKKNQSSASLVFVSKIHRWPVDSLHKGPVARKMFPFDDVIMGHISYGLKHHCSLVMHMRVSERDVSSSVEVMAYDLFGTKPLPKTKLTFSQSNQNSVKFDHNFLQRKGIRTCL